MATIRVRVSNGTRHVTVRGNLSARDLQRLERACAPALEHRRVPLEIRIRKTQVVDAAARIFLTRLAARGALVRDPAPRHESRERGSA